MCHAELHGVQVTRYGLEYPNFFGRLYQLLTPDAFASRHRAAFFRLADAFLSSGLVPAYTAAAFVKRFARLGAAAPPAGAMVAIAFIHNLVRRHPSLIIMLHNPRAAYRAAVAAAAAGGIGGGGDAAGDAEPLFDDAYIHGDGAGSTGRTASAAGGAGSTAAAGAAGASGSAAAAAAAGPGVDVYDGCEADPAKSRAVESSLWELAALRAHYCPQVGGGRGWCGLGRQRGAGRPGHMHACIGARAPHEAASLISGTPLLPHALAALRIIVNTGRTPGVPSRTHAP